MSTSTSQSVSVKTTTSSTDQKVVLTSLRKPKYHPMRAHNIYRALNYTDNMINTQEAMLENLRWTRKELEKDDRELRELQHRLTEFSYRRRPIRYKGQDEEEQEEEEE